MKQLAPNAHVLVINVTRIGDTLLNVPALRALKAALPDGSLTVLGHPKRVSVLKHLPFIDRLGAITPLRAQFKARLPGKKRFDVAFVYHDHPALLAYARRVARYTVGFTPSDRLHAPDLDLCVDKPREGHAVALNLALPAAMGVPAVSRKLEFALTEAEQRRAQQWLRQQGLADARVIGLQVASFPTKAYRDWPVHHFAELIQWLLSDDPTLKFLILGDALSRSRASALQASFPDQVFSAAGAFNLRENAAVMAQLALYIGVDTGPTHMANALGIPMVSLYHCMHPSTVYGPLERDFAATVDHPAPASRCGRTTPMSEITVAAVYAAFTSVWQRCYPAKANS